MVFAVTFISIFCIMVRDYAANFLKRIMLSIYSYIYNLQEVKMEVTYTLCWLVVERDI